MFICARSWSASRLFTLCSSPAPTPPPPRHLWEGMSSARRVCQCNMDASSCSSGCGQVSLPFAAPVRCSSPNLLRNKRSAPSSHAASQTGPCNGSGKPEAAAGLVRDQANPLSDAEEWGTHCLARLDVLELQHYSVAPKACGPTPC
jgi:hypothetical protein